MTQITSPLIERERVEIATLAYLAEGYAKKAATFGIGTLSAYLRCGYIKASILVAAMQKAGLIEISDADEHKPYKWVGDK